MSNIKQLGFLLFLCILASCTSNNSKKLSAALSMAGDNKAELEKVLKYYSSEKPDSLKYKAACFLIENMPWHYSFADTLWVTNYYNAIDSISKLENRNILFDSIRIKYKDMTFDTEQQSDLKCITGEYLINSIDYSFDVWQNSNWAQHIDFDDFCEYILPYKIMELQILDDWKEYFSSYGRALGFLQYGDMFKNSSYKACAAVLSELRSKVSIRVVSTEGLPISRMRTLANIPYGSCEDYCNLSAAVLRAGGIPCAIDYTPQWSFRSLGHSWCVLLNNRGKHTVFDISERVPGYPHKEDHKFAKIFRKTYAINDELYELHKKEKYIPEEFENICIKDVTDEYMVTKNIKIKVNKKNARYAYLALFDNEKWVPVHWGKIKNGEVEFTKMGRDAIYLPVCYGKNGMYAAGNPIQITSNGKMVSLTPDTINRKKLLLYRKHPYLHDPFVSIMHIIDGKIQASNDKDFKNCETFYTIDKPSSYYKEIDINPDSLRFRYWRYRSPDYYSFCDIAELAFFEKDSIHPIEGQIIGSESSSYNNPNRTIHAAFDKNPLTSFDIPVEKGAWVGMDFGAEVNIGKVRYLAKGDGNNIEPDDEYELFYWDADWVSLGKQQATGIFLAYENCPANAVFLLRNYSRGKEERIFTYENGEQVWW